MDRAHGTIGKLIISNMKNMFNKILCMAVMASAFVFPAKAQLTTSQWEEKTLPVGEFSSVEVVGDFEVALTKGAYSVRLTADKVLIPYVQVYVRSKTLYVAYDEKAVPKDVKKLYKGKDAPKPVFRAVVSMPELNGIKLDDNVMLASAEEFYGSKVTISLAGKSQIKNLTIHADDISLDMKKNAQAVITLNADSKLEVNTDDKAILKLTEKAKEFTLNAKGSSDNAVSGEGGAITLKLGEKASVNMSQNTKKVTLEAGGSSSLVLNGKAESLEVKGDKNATVDATAFPVERVNANLGGGRVDVNVEKELKVTLDGGSTLVYAGSPTVLVGKIVKSTLAPAGALKK